MEFDLVVTGGHLIDPRMGISDRRDVGVRDGRVAAVDTTLPSDRAGTVIDAGGLLVVPGLIDLHTHIYPGATFWGIHPDRVAASSGVTTWVDAGSAGAFNIAGFREFLAASTEVNTRGFLNVSAIGLTAHDFELTNPELFARELFDSAIRANRDFVVGGKVRMGRRTLGSSGVRPLVDAISVLQRHGLAVMVHIAQAPPDLDDFGHLLRPGDVVTHSYTPQSMKLIDDAGELSNVARRWLDGGILFDVGHGSGGFSFGVADQMMSLGIEPHFISSDLHQLSVDGPVFDLPTCLTKMLMLGMSLDDVVAAATSRPAAFLGMSEEIGTLAVGARADIALFELTDEPLIVVDAMWDERTAPRRLVHRSTYLGGVRFHPRGAPESRPPYLDWQRAGRDRELVARQAEFRRNRRP